ncbi:MAG: hypothetical protein KKC75_07080 [Nanoarchaeota archaeon]|nr:hypothetical protein [Nanoarchaeota archaeon]MBU1005451.1 hypothetical protein [Nanoarchaeota archaeon]MBU1947021.1 hypothetical protein [Nanoarchaeota archaeon]
MAPGSNLRYCIFAACLALAGCMEDSPSPGTAPVIGSDPNTQKAEWNKRKDGALQSYRKPTPALDERADIEFSNGKPEEKVIWEDKHAGYRVIEGDNLDVRRNNKNNKDYYIVQVSQADGEKRLMDLALTAHYEDSWAFFEMDGKPYFLDCGYKQKVNRSDSNASLLYSFFRSKGISSFTRYHIHPLSAVFSEINKDVKKRALGEKELLKRVRKTYSFILKPSPSDYRHHKSVEKESADKGLMLFPSRICTPYSVLEYDTRNVEISETETELIIDQNIRLRDIIGTLFGRPNPNAPFQTIYSRDAPADKLIFDLYLAWKEQQLPP